MKCGMKLARLYLKAFGPFRDRVIDLPTDAGKDLHVVFGPNEAGKSTILRAVTGFLFGIPERTGDAFLHDYGALRVGATLFLADGNRMSAMRRKGRKATLFAIDEESNTEATDRPLPESTILDLLGGLDQALYQNLFGLDLTGLIAGSEQLLRGEGEIGRSLFQAAAGVAGLQGLIAGFDDEATAVFKPHGSTGRLNRALREFDEQKRILKEKTVRSSAWEAAEREHRQAQDSYGQLRAALKGKRAEQHRLERIRANLPLVAERRAKRAELYPLGEVPLLPPDAAQRRAAAEERLRAAEETQGAAQAQRVRLEAELEGLVVRRTVLEHAGAIEQVFHEIAGYRAARAALPGIAAQRADQTNRIRQLIVEIEPACDIEQAARLLPEETLVARVQALIEEHARLADRDEQLDAQARAKEAALERLNERLASLPEPAPVDELEASLTGVANVADRETRKRQLDQDIAALDDKLRREAAGLWAGTVSELIVLAVPLPETATAFEEEFALLAQGERSVTERLSTLAHDMEERSRELRALAATGEVVTQAEVMAARGKRDESWSRMRRIYIERCAEPTELTIGDRGSQALANALEEAIEEADRLADRLHADTERATNLETTRQRIADMQAATERLDRERERLAEKRQDAERRWEALIDPLRRPELDPKALREWLSRHQRLGEKHCELEALRRERDGVGTDLARARAVLDRALVACALAGWAAEETAREALARAQQAVHAAGKARGERGSIADQIEAGKAELRDLRDQRRQVAAKRSEWRLHWAAATKRLRLSADALPAETKARLDQLSRLAAALKERDKLDTDAKSHGAVVTDFEARIAEIARAVEEASEGHDPDVLAARLYAALREARGAEQKREQLANAVARETRMRDQAETDAQRARTKLDELVCQAGCRTVEELPEVEAVAARKQALEQRLVEIEELLVKQNARPIEEVMRETEGFDLDGLARQIADVADAIEDLEGRVEAAQTVRFGTQQRLEAIDGGPAAAEAQQALSSLSARIAKEARAYARARLAGAVLNRVIQIYRDRHQGPLLKRAAEVFARITLGSFSGLTVDYEDDRQVLLGVRPNDARVPVTGMSQGTRDQLFLALRLAAIEQHLESRGAIPVIIDDLLVQFDDDRAIATMQVLADLSRKTQVLFFTHHRHLIELARSRDLASAMSVHDL